MTDISPTKPTCNQFYNTVITYKLQISHVLAMNEYVVSETQFWD